MLAKRKTMSRPLLIASLAINIAMAIMVALAWGSMAFGAGLGMLAARGLASLKYFTVLSNILLAIASVAYAIGLGKVLAGKAQAVSRGVHVLKYAGTVSVGLTFATVMLFLGPTMGYAFMFAGANLWLHLVVPVLAMVEFVALDHFWELTLRDNLCAILPLVVYGIGYVGNILINGVGSGYATNDWYGFTMFGMHMIPVVYLVMVAVTFCIGALVRFAHRKLAARKALVP